MAEDGSYNTLYFDDDTIKEAQWDYNYEAGQAKEDTKFVRDSAMKLYILRELNTLFLTYDYFLVKVYW
jgi:hypothetical protein